MDPRDYLEARGAPGGILVNDVHAALSPTRVARILRPASVAGVQAAVRDAAATGMAVSIAGGRHAMGGQPFGSDTLLLDLRGLDRILDLDPAQGEVEAEAGIMWPALVAGLEAMQVDDPEPWSIVQKQTGADRLTIGGALSANIHGRGLAFAPIVQDVASFDLVDASGDLRRCSRDENPDLFAHAIGGYGLFGVIVSVRLRLQRRYQVERVVEVVAAETLPDRFAERIAAGFTYGDFQFDIDPAGSDFLRSGVFSCYRPVAAQPVSEEQRALSSADWQRLILLAHLDKRAATDRYTAHYLATSGQRYWSDLHQMADYRDGYHAAIDAVMASPSPCSEMISEIYVPRPDLPAFLARAASDIRESGANLIYGTVRLIEPDRETTLPWAREAWACTIFNLHVEHTPAGVEAAAGQFQRMIDAGLAFGGSYYPTYHRWATREQVIAAHPGFVQFLRGKLRHDPEERFQSEWWRYYQAMFADRLA
jgi:FAD/FMN-containing dehydrogenase